MRRKTSAILLSAIALSLSVQVQGAKPLERDVISISALPAGQPKDSITCLIKGTVIDRPETTSAMIVEAGKDFRIHDYITVPVVDGIFSYILHDTIPMAYDVIFDDELKRGSWRIRNFFSGNGEVNLFYHNRDKADEDSVASTITDNMLAEKFSIMKKAEIQEDINKLYALIDMLYENKTAHSKDVQELYDKLDSLPKGGERDSIMDLVGRRFKESRENASAHSKFYTKEYLEYEKELTDLYFKSDLMKRSLISENPSLYGLYSIKEALMRGNDASGWLDIPAY